MDYIENMRHLMESLELNEEPQDESNDYSEDYSSDDSSTDVADDTQPETEEPEITDTAASSFKSIMSSLKAIASTIPNGGDNTELCSGLARIASELAEISGSSSIEEENGTEGMGPTLTNDNGQVTQNYNDPSGDSYAARNGFVG